MDLTTEEHFHEKKLGEDLSSGVENFEIWQKDRMVNEAAAAMENSVTDRSVTSLGQSLLTDETFPLSMEQDPFGNKDDPSHGFVMSSGTSPIARAIFLPPKISDRKEATSPTQVPAFRKWKSKRIPAKRLPDDFTVSAEVARVIHESYRLKILSSNPTLYSLLRAWVLQDSPHRVYCIPKRKTLLEYAMLRRRSNQSPGSNQNPQTLGVGRRETPVDTPPVDILEWLRSPATNRGLSPYSETVQQRIRTYYENAKRLRKEQRSSKVHQARVALRRKGISLR